LDLHRQKLNANQKKFDSNLEEELRLKIRTPQEKVAVELEKRWLFFIIIVALIKGGVCIMIDLFICLSFRLYSYFTYSVAVHFLLFLLNKNKNNLCYDLYKNTQYEPKARDATG